jgi:hypothetical protein
MEERVMMKAIGGHRRSGFRVAAVGWLAASVCGAVAAEFDPGADPAALAAEYVKAERVQALGAVKRAAIAQFRVEFAVENEGKAQSSGTRGWTSSKADIKLVGVGDDTRQAIADRLHDQFVQQLAVAGFEVVAPQALRDNEAYKSLGPVLRTSLEPVGTQTGKSVFVGARGLPYYLTNEDRHLGVGTLLGGLSTTQPQNIEPQIAKSLDAAVFRVTMLVAFAEQSSSGGFFNNRSSVQSSARLALVPRITQWLVITPDGPSRVVLDQAVPMAGDGMELVETTSDKAAQAVANAITGLLAGGVRRTATYEARTTPQAYEAVVTRYGQALQAAMMSALRPGRPPAATAATAAGDAASTPAR